MTIQKYPSKSVYDSSYTVVISSGLSNGTPAEGFWGMEYTIDKPIPGSNFATISPVVFSGRITIGGLNQSLSIGSEQVIVSAPVTSYKIAVSSGWRFGTFVGGLVVASNITGFAYGNGRFVVKGTKMSSALLAAESAMAVSTDGINWTTGISIVTSPTNTTFAGRNTLSFANGYFIGNGNFPGNFTISTDGINWTTRGITLTSVSWIVRMAYGNSRYVAQSNSGLSAWSTDLLTWTTAPTNIANGNNLKFVNNFFIVTISSGFIQVSTDGINWTTRNTGTGQTMTQVAYGNNAYVSVGSTGAFASSTDTITWTVRSVGTYTGNMGDVEFANGYFVAVGNSGTSNQGGAFSSTDGAVWTSRSLGPERNAAASGLVKYGSNYWMAVDPTSNFGGTRYFYADNPAGWTDGVGTGYPYNAVTVKNSKIDLTY